MYLQRLERQTRAMDQAQYVEFCESRQLSFGKTLIKLLSTSIIIIVLGKSGKKHTDVVYVASLCYPILLDCM